MDNMISSIPPSFLCDMDGTILISNKPTEERSLTALLNTNISEYISAADALRYDITIKSKKPRPFTAAAKLVCGKRFLAIAPATIADSRFAIVTLAKSPDEAKAYIAPTKLFSFDDLRLLCERLEISKRHPKGEYGSELFDISKALKLILAKLSAEIPGGLSFTLNDSCHQDVLHCDVGLNCFASIITAIVFALNNISAGPTADIFVSSIERTCHIAFEAEIDKGYAAKSSSPLSELDLTDLHTDFLRFVSECADCDLAISIEGSKLKIVAAFSEIDEEIDFKSNDPLKHLDKIFEKAFPIIQSIYKAADRE